MSQSVERFCGNTDVANGGLWLGAAHTIKVKLTVRMDAELPGTAREYRQVGRRP